MTMAIDIINIIKSYTMDDLWANVKSDNQKILKPASLTSLRGVRGSVKLPFAFYAMPDATSTFALYQAGQVTPDSLGFHRESFVNWTSLTELCTKHDTIVIPMSNGKVVPLAAIKVIIVKYNLLFAIDMSMLGSNFPRGDAELSIRFYSNEWFTRREAYPESGITMYSGVVGHDSVTGSSVVTKYNAMLNALPEGTICFKNGIVTTNPNQPTIVNGDYFTIFSDSSIHGSIEVPITDLVQFSSVLYPNKRRSLLSLPKADLEGMQWHDDMEIIFLNPQSSNGTDWHIGMMYPAEQDSDISQVTLADISLSSEKISSMNDLMPELNATDTICKVYLRKTVTDSIITQNGNLTHDLFMFTDEQRKKLITKYNPSVNFWNVAELENSGFSKFAFTEYEENLEIGNVLSYYGILTYAQNPKFKTVGEFRIPPNMRWGGLLLEFNDDGEFLQMTSWHTGQYSESFASLPATRTMKCIPGLRYDSASRLDIFSDYIDDSVSDWYEERFYRSGASSTYIQAIEDVDFTVDGDKATWKPIFENLDKMKRRANGYALAEKTVPAFDISRPMNLFDDDVETPSGFGFGHYYAFLNGHILIEDIDFKIEFPYAYILNADYADKDGDNHVIVIGHGCPGTRNEYSHGFVERSLISTDDNFLPTMFRNKDFIIDGKLKKETDIIYDNGYSHPDSSIVKLDSSIEEGTTYAVSDFPTYLSLGNLKILKETYAEAIEKDTLVAGELKEVFVKQDSDDTPILINEKNTIVSILLNTLLNEIKDGKLIISNGTLSDLAVSILIKPYKHLLEADISRSAIEQTYIEVALHCGEERIDLTVWQHDFLSKVNRIYLEDRCVLSKYLNI